MPKMHVKNPLIQLQHDEIHRSSLDGVRPVLYSLPELLKTDVVYIVEGEKDVNNLRRTGLTATCNPGGAGKWREESTQLFFSNISV